MAEERARDEPFLANDAQVGHGEFGGPPDDEVVDDPPDRHDDHDGPDQVEQVADPAEHPFAVGRDHVDQVGADQQQDRRDRVPDRRDPVLLRAELDGLVIDEVLGDGHGHGLPAAPLARTRTFARLTQFVADKAAPHAPVSRCRCRCGCLSRMSLARTSTWSLGPATVRSSWVLKITSQCFFPPPWKRCSLSMVKPLAAKRVR